MNNIHTQAMHQSTNYTTMCASFNTLTNMTPFLIISASIITIIILFVVE